MFLVELAERRALAVRPPAKGDGRTLTAMCWASERGMAYAAGFDDGSLELWELPGGAGPWRAAPEDMLDAALFCRLDGAHAAGAPLTHLAASGTMLLAAWPLGGDDGCALRLYALPLRAGGLKLDAEAPMARPPSSLP